jgi:2-polyprenyl-6-methoxyphenol hydroxylase-like FAD-dependent oxidoreductase
MAGLELAATGADVRIYERSERVPDDRGAGIVMQPETLHVLTSRCGLREEERFAAPRFLRSATGKPWRSKVLRMSRAKSSLTFLIMKRHELICL